MLGPTTALRVVPAITVAVTVLASAVSAQETFTVNVYSWYVTGVDIQGHVIPLVRPVHLNFMVPDPDFAQVQWNTDVDGDGVPDHLWCGEVASLTLYNVAVAEGIWTPCHGPYLTPLAMERLEEKFHEETGIPVEDTQEDGPVMLSTPPWFPALVATAADKSGDNGIGVVVYAPLVTNITQWLQLIPPALHSVVLMGCSSDGRYFVVKDCSYVEENPEEYSWKDDYYFVPAYSLELNIMSAANYLVSQSTGVPLVYFPVDGRVPEYLEQYFIGKKTVDLGGGLKATFYVFLANTLSDIMDVCKELAENDVPVLVIVREPFAWLRYQGNLVKVPLVNMNILRILSLPIDSLVVGSGGTPSPAWESSGETGGTTEQEIIYYPPQQNQTGSSGGSLLPLPLIPLVPVPPRLRR